MWCLPDPERSSEKTCIEDMGTQASRAWLGTRNTNPKSLSGQTCVGACVGCIGVRVE